MLIFLGTARYTGFFRSVGISPVLWIMFRSFVISLTPNSHRVVTISGGISPSFPSFLIFFSRIWGLSSLLMIVDRSLSSWYNAHVFLYLDQSTFALGRSPALKFVLTGNLMLVAGRVVLRTGMGL